MSEMNGNKLIRKYDNPVDIILNDIAEKLAPYFKRMYMTPNHITTIGNILD